MDSDKKEYGLIIKSLSILGSAQVVSLIIALLRSKVIVLFLGAKGIAIAGLFNSTINLFSITTSLGLEKSAVKEVSFVHEQNQSKRKIELISLIRRLGIYTSILGAFFMFCLSNRLSLFVFKTSDYSYAFSWLALALIFKQLSQINLSIIQGGRGVSNLARANVYGSAIGLLFSLPLYYFLGIKAIVPAIIISYLIAFFVSYYYHNRIVARVKISINLIEDFKKGKGLIKLGVALNFSSLVSMLSVYAFQVYLTNNTTLKIVGLYLAGTAILNYAVNIVFNALSTDYYPRLASLNNNGEKFIKILQKQVLIALLIITPIIVFVGICAPFFIRLLYSSKFLEAFVFIKWAILGMLFKAISWSVAYAFVAKGDSKVFFRINLISSIILLAINILGFNLDGLEGLGVSFLIYHIIYFFLTFFIAKNRYKFRFDKGFYYHLSVAVVLCLLSFFMTYLFGDKLRYILGALLIIISFSFTLYSINKKMNLKEFLNK